MKKKIAMLLICVLTLSLVGCGGNEMNKDDKSFTETSSETKDDSETSVISVVDNRTDNDIVKGINTFSFQIQDMISEHTSVSENALVSPYSIVMAFSMLDNAADNATKEQIEKTFGIVDLDAWNEQVRALFDKEKNIASAANDVEVYPQLITSNSLWMDSDFEMSDSADEVVAAIKDYYNGDIFSEDFSSYSTAEKIDNWINESTKGLIKSIGADVSNLESLLINTIYFKGVWQTEFPEGNTREQDFRTSNGTSKTDFMSIYSEKFKYMEKNGLKAISLPYIGCYIEDTDSYEEFDMVLIESLDDSDLTTDRFDSMSVEDKMAFLSELSDVEDLTNMKEVRVPKFNYECDYDDIVADFMNLGIINAFDCECSDLSKLSEGLYVRDVKHKAVISVDEHGTEAAAMTALMLDNMAFIQEEEPTKEFIADKPFTYVIRNSDTGLIYFIGTVNSL